MLPVFLIVSGYININKDRFNDKRGTTMKYAAVGCWDYKKENGGIAVVAVDENTGHLSLLKKYCTNVNVGSTPAFDGKDTIYFIDETANMDYAPYGGGGGGYVYAARIDRESGELTILNKVRSLGTNPCYCALDQERKHLLVVHHTSSSHNVTKLVRKENGEIDAEILYDDASVLLFDLNPDGSIGKALDYHIHPQNGLRHTLLHSIYEFKGLFLTSDKGQDRIYSYRISDGKIELLDSLEVGKFTACRYMSFHPTLNIAYGTNEKKQYINVYHIEPETGKLALIKDEFIFEDSEYSRFNAKFATDCIVTPNGRYLYVALAAFSGEDRIVTMDLDQEGMPTYRHYNVIQGKCPKALAMSEDGRYLYACNAVSGDISVYQILENGDLLFKENVKIPCGASLRFL